MSGIDALPGVPASALPPDVRNGAPEDQRAYRAALGFEGLLLRTVVKDMTRSGGLDGSPYATTIEDSFSNALLAAGALGLGEQLYRDLRPEPRR